MVHFHSTCKQNVNLPLALYAIQSLVFLAPFHRLLSTCSRLICQQNDKSCEEIHVDRRGDITGMTIRIAKLFCATPDTAVCVLSGMLKVLNAFL